MIEDSREKHTWPATITYFRSLVIIKENNNVKILEVKS